MTVRAVQAVEDCYIMKLYLRRMDDLEAILDRFTPYGRTTTSIVHSTPIPRRPLPIDGFAGNGDLP
jgi:Lrp/AsnC family leucine-responsive transcriptional regulator